MGGVFTTQLFLYQCTFTLFLTLFLVFKIAFNPIKTENFLIASVQKRKYLSDYQLTNYYPLNERMLRRPKANCVSTKRAFHNKAEVGLNAKECYQAESTDVYTISRRSRYTQWCIFLFLVYDHSSKHSQLDKDQQVECANIRNKEHLGTSRLIFKWELGQSHYRALTSTISQSMKVTK